MLVAAILLILFFHAVYTTSFLRACLIFTLLLISSLALEYTSLHFTPVPGFSYTFYLPGIHIYDVPLTIVLGWAVTIYLAYSVTNSVLTFVQKKELRKKTSYLAIFPLIFSDATLGTALDFTLDPVAVYQHQWSYSPVGSFYGVPLFNFLAWFSIIAFFSFILRTMDFYYPKPAKGKRSTLLLPIIIYSLIYLICIFFAFKYQLGGAVLVSVTALLLLVTVYVRRIRISQ